VISDPGKGANPAVCADLDQLSRTYVHVRRNPRVPTNSNTASTASHEVCLKPGIPTDLHVLGDLDTTAADHVTRKVNA
jgi:hypothetical protein